MVKRIVNGFTVPTPFAPYAVFVEIDLGNNVAGLCGGSIISPNHILTAAHCVTTNGKAIPAANLTIGYGSETKEKQKNVVATAVAVLPGFLDKGSTNLLFDLAVLTIPTLTFTENVQRIPVYPQKIGPGQGLMATGWGLTADDHLSDTLLGAVLVTGDLAYCKSITSSFVDSNGPRVCILTKLTPGVSTCEGDSGTSVVISSGNVPMLAGVVSLAVYMGKATCVDSNSARFFMHPYYYIDFIAQATGMSKSYLTTTDSTYNKWEAELSLGLPNEFEDSSSGNVVVTETVIITPSGVPVY
ncbi:trypsin-like cysteine/serine peptidase domain-containing protein [Coemansia spiralis]|nr:trypsin-like cysteine/serine peptidase domain-containing protein [Coemansia spiralis]